MYSWKTLDLPWVTWDKALCAIPVSSYRLAADVNGVEHVTMLHIRYIAVGAQGGTAFLAITIMRERQNIPSSSIEHPPPKHMPWKALKATGQGQVGHLASHWEGSRAGLSGHSSAIPAVILSIRANDCLHRLLMTRAWQSVQLQYSRYSAHVRNLSSPSCLSRPCKSNDSLTVRRRKVDRQLQLMSAATSDSAATKTRAVPLSELRELVHDSLLGLTYSKREAEIIGDVSIVVTVA